MRLILRKLQLLCVILFSFSILQVFADTGFEESFEDELIDIEESANRFEFFGDVQLRIDSVRDLPRLVEKDFDRVTARARMGVLWLPNDTVEVGLAAKVNVSSQSNSKSRFNLDNERADDIELDELFFNYILTEQTSVLFGQTHFPLQLSPMLWDHDLRPQGLSVNHRRALSEFNSFDIVGGFFLGNHQYGDDSNIRAIQAALNIGEGKNTSYSIVMSYLDFNNLNDLATNDLLRTNSGSVLTGFSTDFDVADIQVNLNLNQHAFPVRIKLDFSNNLAIGHDDFAGRADLILGNSIRQQGIEIGVATQRIQQDALVAAFNDDDWWFPTQMRGTTAWLAYGFNESLRFKFAVFTERRDNRPKHNKRALFDLQYFF